MARPQEGTIQRLVTFFVLFALQHSLVESVHAQAGHPTHQMFTLGDFKLEAGMVLPSAKLLFVIYGHSNADSSNAIVTVSYHGGTHHGYDFQIGPGLALADKPLGR